MGSPADSGDDRTPALRDIRSGAADWKARRQPGGVVYALWAILIGVPLLAVAVLLQWNDLMRMAELLVTLRFSRLMNQRLDVSTFVGAAAAMVGAALVVGGTLWLIYVGRRSAGR